MPVSSNGWSEPLYTPISCVCEHQRLAWAFIYVPLFNGWPEHLYTSLSYVCEQQLLAKALIYVPHLYLWVATAGLSLYIRPSFVSVSINGWPEHLYTSLSYVCEQQLLAKALIYVPHLYLWVATAGLSLYIRPSFVSVSINGWPEHLYTSLSYVCEQQLLAKALIYVPHLYLWVATAGLSLYIRPSFVSVSSNGWPEHLYTSLSYVCEQQLLAKALIYVPHLYLWVATAGLSLYTCPTVWTWDLGWHNWIQTVGHSYMGFLKEFCEYKMILKKSRL